jgi:benzoate membrane transport protein
MFKDLSMQSFVMGVLTAFVGFASSFAVVLQGLKGMGASDIQAASGLMALSVAMGLCGVLLSLKTRMPISIAWSTPGAAFLATSGPLEGGFAVAVGAFLVTGALIVAAGLFKPLNRAVSSIPAPLANAMLAGVLIGLCFAPVKAVAFNPWFGLPIVIAYFIGGAINRLAAIPLALVAFVFVIAFGVEIPDGAFAHVGRAIWPAPELVAPQFSREAIMSIALPLFIITMAGQNIPGITVLRVNGYEPAPGPLFTTTGIFSLLAAPFGGHAVNLAAITAAMCAGEDAHRDPARRYAAAVRGAVAGDPDRGCGRTCIDRRLFGLGHGGIQGARYTRGGGGDLSCHGVGHRVCRDFGCVLGIAGWRCRDGAWSRREKISREGVTLIACRRCARYRSRMNVSSANISGHMMAASAAHCHALASLLLLKLTRGCRVH